eukprot:c47029_g1_i1 orf=311-619(-)
MALDDRVDNVTGNTFTSANISGFPSSQIMPYTQSYTEAPQKTTKQVKIKFSKSWNANEAEMKRKKRVASYKVYAVERRVKISVRKSIGWLKAKCIGLRYGWS